jgi:hypothetical protein
MLNVFMLNVVMLNVIMLNVIMLSGVAPLRRYNTREFNHLSKVAVILSIEFSDNLN